MRPFEGMRGAMALAAIAAIGLTGCGAGGEDPGNTLGNLFAYNSTKAPPIAPEKKTYKVECPIVQVPDGGGGYRIYAGADKSNTAVKTQFSLGELSRECAVEDNRIDIRVGISGYVLAGPVGGPGSFTVPVKVDVVRASDRQVAATRTFRIAATIPPGADQAPFSLVTDPISVPFLGEQADDDYSLFVGLDQSGGAARPEPRRRARRK